MRSKIHEVIRLSRMVIWTPIYVIVIMLEAIIRGTYACQISFSEDWSEWVRIFKTGERGK
jgi:hypothetical protein